MIRSGKYPFDPIIVDLIEVVVAEHYPVREVVNLIIVDLVRAIKEENDPVREVPLTSTVKVEHYPVREVTLIPIVHGETRPSAPPSQ